MLSIYDLGGVNISSTASSSKMVSVFVDKLHELGLSETYDSSNFSFGTSVISGTQEITFKDGTKSEILFRIPSETSDAYPEYVNGLKRVLFVDEENHFIMCSTAMSTFLSTKTSENISYYIQGFCCDDWYGENVTYLGNQSTNSNNHFNIPTMKLTNTVGDKFTLYPLYMVIESAIPKNLYFSPDKTYPVGSIMTDTSGNEYVSVAPRFFYHSNSEV